MTRKIFYFNIIYGSTAVRFVLNLYKNNFKHEFSIHIPVKIVFVTSSLSVSFPCEVLRKRTSEIAIY